MSGTWGKNIKLSIFGESHGSAIGITIDGLEPGLEIDIEAVKKEMDRRAPGRSPLATARRESDTFEILSGYFNDRTTGTPLCAIIRNADQHSKDYGDLKKLMRPGHADYTGNVRYKGFNDYRGGGHFSGRITAPLVFAGAIAKQILANKGIIIGSHIKSIEKIQDASFEEIDLNEDLIRKLSYESFPVINKSSGDNMQELILKVKKDLDSVGGIVETVILNLPSGIGSPFFDSVESHLSSIIFSIPATKGIEFGKGFDISALKGSEANDEFYIENDIIKTKTNNNGGILGGITSGMPLVFRTAIKPTASISREQHTVDIEAHKNATLSIKGRHDPCIVPRAVPVIEAASAIAILDLMLDIR
ncbi:chorismate synthase [Clostridium acidisoli DSM 12555]|uniref:Chorismate synthase n=1 Tax=Clostridium acidisoli DSM 12555 TaxID=1121291 RepID=A0A1W1XUB9_9CLOT|nr:chorismate synthase [Clostridium acidisoli]SMC27553.1 chorismate synthase [Clostridium acidisoli DSM 12555]